MSWNAPRTFITGEVETAAIFNTHLRDNLVALQPQVATIATTETTANAAYTNLTTVGPAITTLTGTQVIVTVGADVVNTGAFSALMSVAVSGATTLAATDANAAQSQGTNFEASSFTTLLTGLTPGTNTFTAKYRSSGGTSSFTFRNLIVIACF